MNENFDSNLSGHDAQYEGSLRPSHWDGYIGQEQIKKNLKVFVTAANKRQESLDHTLLFGPPGLGKTTLAHIIATEMNTSIKVTAAPMIEKAGDLAAMLTNLEAGDILFIDEIHRLSPAVEEILYPAMEDYRLDIIIGSGPTAQSVSIDLPRFTIIGATTRAGMISNPLRDRFGMHFRLQFYKQEELASIIDIAANKLNKPASQEANMEMARRSRGTPRIALRLLRRVRDFAEVEDENSIDISRTQFALGELGINDHGFDEQDIKLLTLLMDNKGKAMGLSTIAAAMSEDEGTIEDVIEPYLLANSYIERTPRGRKATAKSYELFKLSAPQALNEGLFNEI